jgi:hypothetical protein
MPLGAGCPYSKPSESGWGKTVHGEQTEVQDRRDCECFVVKLSKGYGCEVSWRVRSGRLNRNDIRLALGDCGDSGFLRARSNALSE